MTVEEAVAKRVGQYLEHLPVSDRQHVAHIVLEEIARGAVERYHDYEYHRMAVSEKRSPEGIIAAILGVRL